ncbi:HK97 gp10 family phage protein [Aliarcobacter cryaerophilus]|uniref:HK97-gp10 family putative phage morphogenesis protein n=1 Tax=Aliarcobacter cryaerophilus TaxID=28198 RepID=UPI003DA30FDA
MGISATFNSQDLLKALSQFPKNIQNNVMTGAIRAGANVIRDEARLRVPKKTKELAKSIVSIKRRAEVRNQVKFSVTPSKGKNKAGWRAHFIEFGTSKMSAKPFLRPAFEVSESKSLDATKDYIAKRIPQEIAKAR